MIVLYMLLTSGSSILGTGGHLRAGWYYSSKYNCLWPATKCTLKKFQNGFELFGLCVNILWTFSAILFIQTGVNCAG